MYFIQKSSIPICYIPDYIQIELANVTVTVHTLNTRPVGHEVSTVGWKLQHQCSNMNNNK